jgi:hypothetical protein
MIITGKPALMQPLGYASGHSTQHRFLSLALH